MSSPFSIIFKPKSIAGLFVGCGILALFMGAGTVEAYPAVSSSFSNLGWPLLFIGIIAWLIFFVPAAARNFR